MLGEIGLILALILLNGFFSLAEMALVSSRKARLRHEAESGKPAYRLALKTAEDPSKFLSSIQIAITLIGVLTGAIGGATVAKGLESYFSGLGASEAFASALSVGIVVVSTTFLSVLLGELVPKNLALSRPEKIAAAVIRPMNAFGSFFFPIVKILAVLTDLIVGLLGFSAHKEPEVTEEEVKVLIAQGAETGIFEDSEREMVEGVLNLDDRRVTSFMTPRTEMVFLDLDDAEVEPRKRVLDNAELGYLPVVRGDLDNVVGILRMRDALASMARGEALDVLALARPPVLIPESLSALRAIATLRAEGVTAALIVDEYGGVSGSVALRDLLDSVIAKIPAEDGASDGEMVRRADGSWLVDGGTAIIDFAERLGLDESHIAGDYETVAGLVLDRMGSIPRAGDICTWDDCAIEIMDMDGNRIDKVLVTRNRPEPITSGPVSPA